MASHISVDYTKFLNKKSFSFSDAPMLTAYINDYGRDEAYKQFLNEDVVKDLDVRMASEDFSYFSQACPSCFFRLGVGNSEKSIKHLVHTPHFNIDEKSLEIGVGLMSYLTIVNVLNLPIV